jgi:hypothetical protein
VKADTRGGFKDAFADHAEFFPRWTAVGIAHLQERAIRAGQRLERGEAIGLVKPPAHRPIVKDRCIHRGEHTPIAQMKIV